VTPVVPVAVGLPPLLFRAAGDPVRLAAEGAVGGLLEQFAVPGRVTAELERCETVRIRVHDRTLPVPAGTFARALSYLDGVPEAASAHGHAFTTAGQLGELVSLLCREAVQAQPEILQPGGPHREMLQLGIATSDRRPDLPWGGKSGRTWPSRAEEGSGRSGHLAILLEPRYLQALTSAASFRQDLGIVVNQLYLDRGLVLPRIDLRPAPELPPGGYAFLIEGVRSLPAIDPSADGPTTSHLFGAFAALLRQRGYMFLSQVRAVAMMEDLVVDAPALGRQARTYLSPESFAWILRELLLDGLPIRNLRRIAELLVRHAAELVPEEALSYVRRGMIDLVLARVGGTPDEPACYRLAAPLAESLTGRTVAFACDVPDSIAEPIRSAVRHRPATWPAEPTVIVAPDAVRRAVRVVLRPEFPDLVVLAEEEISGHGAVRWLGTVG
jgi:hypothetical protein